MYTNKETKKSNNKLKKNINETKRFVQKKIINLDYR